MGYIDGDSARYERETGSAPEDNPFGKLSLDDLRQQCDEYAKGALDAVLRKDDLFERQVRKMLASVKAEIKRRLNQGEYDRASSDCAHQLMVELNAREEMSGRIYYRDYGIAQIGEEMNRLFELVSGRGNDLERRRDASFSSGEHETRRASRTYAEIPVGKERDELMKAAGQLLAVANAIRAKDSQAAWACEWEVINIHKRVFGYRQYLRK